MTPHDLIRYYLECPVQELWGIETNPDWYIWDDLYRDWEIMPKYRRLGRVLADNRLAFVWDFLWQRAKFYEGATYHTQNSVIASLEHRLNAGRYAICIPEDEYIRWCYKCWGIAMRDDKGEIYCPKCKNEPRNGWGFDCQPISRYEFVKGLKR